MTDHNPNRPVGGGTPPPERGMPGDRPVGAPPPPEYRGSRPPGDSGNSAMALIIGALAVALIIGAFFWFAGDTQDTAVLDQPVTTQQETVPPTTEPQATEPQTTAPQATEEPATGIEQDTGQTGTQ
jgi:hypothetical protein